MSVICPTVTAFNATEYSEQLKRIAPFAKRVHIDLMDGQFAPSRSPSFNEIRMPHDLEVDIHLMYQEPMAVLEQLIRMRPHMVVIHNEASVHHMHFTAELHKHGINVGLAILQETPIEWAYQIMHSFDHVLVFSGHLGYHGGQADLGLLDKVRKIQEHHPDAEIGWDGGINADNARQLIQAGVEVLNVGGFIQKSDNPSAAYATLIEITEGK